MKQKIQFLLMAALFVCTGLGFTACGDDDDDDIVPPTSEPTAISFYNDPNLYSDGTLIYHLENAESKEMSVWYPLDKDNIEEVSIPARLSYEGEVYTVTQLSTQAFARCYNLKKAVIPSPVTALGDYSFAWDESLTTVSLSSSLTTIGEYAFAWCENLTSVNIPATVTTIGMSAFGWCEKLTNVYVHWKTPIVVGTHAFLTYSDSPTLHVPAGTKAAYEAEEAWSKFTIVEDADKFPVK